MLLGQELHQDGNGNVAIQVSGDGNTVTVSCGGIVLRLSGKHTRKRQPRTELDVLRADVRALDLVGRDAELTDLEAWLDDPRPVLARGIKGRAGSGKTRLAIELCERAAARGWAAGFLDSGDLTAFVEAERVARWQPASPLLVVVDYAARRARSLNAWLLGLARRTEGDRPHLRLLFLERHGSAEEGWWSELLQRDGSDDALLDLVDPLEPVPLEPITGAALRRALLAGAMAQGCRLAGRAILAPPAMGADPAFERRLAGAPAAEPLFLTMRGLFAARHGLDSFLSLGRLDLALELACWERDRLRTFARDRGVNEKMLLHLVACVTLQRGLSRRQRFALIDAEAAALPYQDRMARDALADVLCDALPKADDGDTLQGIEPDLIGETFCLLCLATNDDLDLEPLIDRCCERAPRDTAQHLVQTVQDFARPSAEFTAGDEHSRRRPEARLLPGWLGEDNPALGWLDRLVSTTDDLERLMSIADQMPEQTVILGELSAFVLQRVVDVLRPVAISSENEAPMAMLATALNNIGCRFRALGHPEAALAAAADAVDIRRELAATRPDRFRPNLAASLHNLANALGDLGQRERALAGAEEAESIYRELAAERPDAFRPDLANSLSNLSNRRSDLGQRERALAAAEEAESIYRELAAGRPDAFRPGLANSLSNLSNRRSDLGQRERALAAAEEAASIYRELAAARPGAFRPDLARSLNNLAIWLSNLGQRERALTAAGEAEAIYRELAAANPKAFRPDLAMSLGNVAGILSRCALRGPALAAAEEAKSIYRELSAEQPDVFRPDLAKSLTNLSGFLGNLGRHEFAIAAAEEAVALYRELASARHDAFQPNLAMSLNNLANSLSNLGRREPALAAAEESVAIRCELVAAHPDAFCADLALSLNNLALRLSDLGRQEAALEAAEEAVAIRRDLAAIQPDAFRPEYARSLGVVANCLAALGRRAKALDIDLSAISILREPFLKLPEAFAHWMEPMVQRYLERSEALGVAPDAALMEPITRELTALHERTQRAWEEEEET